jgi:hypothetical protein
MDVKMQQQQEKPAVRFDDFVALHGIAVSPVEDFDGYAVAVVLPPDWEEFDAKVWSWRGDPFISKFGANAVLTMSRVAAPLDPAEVFDMLCEWQLHMVPGVRLRNRGQQPAVEGPGIVGSLLMDIDTTEYGLVDSASRTRIITTGEETLIVQLTITALHDSPVDRAHIRLAVASADVAGPASVSYGGAASGGLEGR